MTQLEPATQQNLEYFIGLKNKLIKTEYGYDPKEQKRVRIDGYTKEQLTTTETQQLFEILQQSSDLILFPCNTNMGFSVGYGVLHVTTQPTPYPGAELPEEYKTLEEFAKSNL